MGTYDVPAEIDLILETTGQAKLFYIGHSMGTTMFFVMMSQRPEYKEKLHAMIALAPTAFFTPTKNPVYHFIQSIGERFLEVNTRSFGAFLLGRQASTVVPAHNLILLLIT
jgi:pimeloyl-ACP methyl ester carboxylesterase